MKKDKPITKAGLGWRDWAIWTVISLAVVAVWYVAWCWIDNHIFSSIPVTQSDEVARGVFGDKFGAINALFSGLAFAGIIFTIYLQRRELALQRLDIEEQNETLRQQRFENGFFHLLTLHADIVDKLEITSHYKRQAFSYFIDLLKGSSEAFTSFQPLSKLTKEEQHQLRAAPVLTPQMQAHLEPGEISTVLEMLTHDPSIVGQYLDIDASFHQRLVDAAYKAAHEKSKDGLSHYFRNLYHVYRFIDESKLIDDEARHAYARIVRAQLSDAELVAILYNCLAFSGGNGDKHLEFGYPKMTRLALKYDVLQNINHQSVIHPIHLRLFTQTSEVKK